MALDGFFFDVEKWFGSIAAQRMSFAEKGVYLTMLFQEWRDRSKSLPDDARAVADLIAVTDAQVAEVVAAWPVVRPKFEPVERVPGRIKNIVIEETRRQQARNYKKKQEAGRAGGKASARKRQTEQQIPLKHSLTTVEPPSTEERGIEGEKEEIRSEESRSGETPDLPPVADDRRSQPRPFAQPDRRGPGKQPPLAGFRQLRVWSWFVDRWLERLGTEADKFVIGDWLADLDGTLAGVLPRTGNDWFELLNRHFEAELERRGLARASAPAVGRRVRGCTHEPPCLDEAAHTRLDMAERRRVS